MVGNITKQLDALAGHVLDVKDEKGVVFYNYAAYMSDSQRKFFNLLIRAFPKKLASNKFLVSWARISWRIARSGLAPMTFTRKCSVSLFFKLSWVCIGC